MECNIFERYKLKGKIVRFGTLLGDHDGGRLGTICNDKVDVRHLEHYLVTKLVLDL